MSSTSRGAVSHADMRDIDKPLGSLQLESERVGEHRAAAAAPSAVGRAPAPKLTFAVRAHRVDAHGSVAACKAATIPLDTDLAGNSDAFNPAELLLAALSACMIKGIERVAPVLQFELRGVEVAVRGVRQDVPPRMESIKYEIIVDTDEPERRLALLHDNVRKFGTVFNTIAPGTTIEGTIRRAN